MMNKRKYMIVGAFLGILAAFALSFGLAHADSWQAFYPPTKNVGTYNMYAEDDLDLSPTNQYCPTYEGQTQNGCWQVKGSEGSTNSPGPSIWDTQEVGEDDCWDTIRHVETAAWMNGPNTGHSNAQSASASIGTTWYSCDGYPNPYHRYCEKSYHKAEWTPPSACYPTSNCILENTFVLNETNDTTTNPGC